MGWRSRAFMTQQCDILRPNIVIDVSNIRDRRITEWGTVKSSVPCYVEPAGSEVIADTRLGRTLVEHFNVYLQGHEPVQAGDRLLIGSTQYLVDGLQDYSDQRAGTWHHVLLVRKMGLAQ